MNFESTKVKRHTTRHILTSVFPGQPDEKSLLTVHKYRMNASRKNFSCVFICFIHNFNALDSFSHFMKRFHFSLLNSAVEFGNKYIKSELKVTKSEKKKRLKRPKL